MSSTHLMLSDDALLAEYVELDRFKGVLQQRVAVGPDLLAMLIKDGEIAEASPGGHFAVGGVWRTLKDAVGGRHAIRMLIADLKPFQLSTSATSLSKDHVPVACEFTVELQVNPERPANVIGLVKAHGSVTKAAILDRLKPHIGERVLNATIRRVDALELRGNNGLQDKVQADTMLEVERVASDLGLIARTVSVAWGFNEEEQAAIARRQREREQEALEREFQILTRSIERETQTTVMRLEADLTIERTKVTTEDELRKLILSNELSFVDARETAIRIEQVKALEHELQLNRTQRLDALKAQLETAQHAVEMTRAGGDKRDVELDIARRERLAALEVTRINAEIRVVERSIEDGDVRQRLTLKRLEEMQNLEIARVAQSDQLAVMRGMQDLELDGERARLDHSLRKGEAEHGWRQAAAQQASAAELEKIRILREGTPEQILAINAGLSPAVANVLIEQARSKATEGAERMALMREMIQQANDARVASETQARHLFESGMQGAVGVAQGVGAAASGRMPTPQGDAPATTECPNCHRVIPVTDRHCRHCGRPMRQ
jgi:hypothetical protein